MVSIVTPEESEAEHERMTACCRGYPDPARPALPPDEAVHRRHGLLRRAHLRSRSMAARPGALSRNLSLLDLHRFPGPPHERALPARGREGARASSTPSTARASRSAARWSRCSRITSRRTARSRCPRRSSPICAGSTGSSRRGDLPGGMKVPSATPGRASPGRNDQNELHRCDVVTFEPDAS